MNFNVRIVVIICLCVLPGLGLAQNTPYQPLVGIPGLGGTGNMETYLNTLYALSISLGALLAVIKIIIAGVKYMLSDVVTTKSAAIGDIQGALIGLLIVIMAWLVLYVINPAILTTEIFMTPPETRQTTTTNRTATREERIRALGENPEVTSLPCEEPGNCAAAEATCASRGGTVITGNETSIECGRTRLGAEARSYAEESAAAIQAETTRRIAAGQSSTVVGSFTPSGTARGPQARAELERFIADCTAAGNRHERIDIGGAVSNVCVN